MVCTLSHIQIFRRGDIIAPDFLTQGFAVHELSVCQALLNQLADLAAERGADRVIRITIEVGPLSGVDPDLLASAFAMARNGGCAAGAALSIERTAVEIACMSCDARSRTAPNRLVCPICGSYRTRVVAGEELRLRRVELHLPQSTAAHATEGDWRCAKPAAAQ